MRQILVAAIILVLLAFAVPGARSVAHAVSFDPVEIQPRPLFVVVPGGTTAVTTFVPLSDLTSIEITYHADRCEFTPRLPVGGSVLWAVPHAGQATDERDCLMFFWRRAIFENAVVSG